jgi:hypothetical protein
VFFRWKYSFVAGFQIEIAYCFLNSKDSLQSRIEAVIDVKAKIFL